MLADVWIAVGGLAEFIQSVVEEYSRAVGRSHLTHGVQDEVGRDVLPYLEVSK